MRRMCIAAVVLLALCAGGVAACSSLVAPPKTHTTVEPADFARTFDSAQIAEDLRFACKVIEDVHPHPFAKSSRDEWQGRIAALAARVDRPLTRLEAWPLMAEFAATLGDAHTSSPAPFEEWNAFLHEGGTVLPFGYEFRGEELVIVRTWAPDGPRPGAVVRSIDGIDCGELHREFAALRAGKSDFVDATLATNLAFHLWRRGASDPFEVVLAGASSAQTVKGWTYAEIQAAKSAQSATARAPSWSLRWLEGDVALIDFRSMDDLDQFRAFLETTFAEMRARPAKGLVVDLRANGGGNSELGDALLGYLADRPYRMCARKEWRSSEEYRHYLKCHMPAWTRPLPLQWFHPVGRKFWGVEPGAMAVFEQDEVQPGPRERRFEGPWCLLIGPRTFSSAMMLANAVADYRLAPLFGEESGGVPNEHGEIYSCDLPNTRLQLCVSSAFFVRSNGDANDPRGVLPTHEVRSSEADLAAGRDAVLEAAREWISANSKAH